MKVFIENFLVVGFSLVSFFDFFVDFFCWCDDRSIGIVIWIYIYVFFGNFVLFEIVFVYFLYFYCNFGLIDGVNVI